MNKNEKIKELEDKINKINEEIDLLKRPKETGWGSKDDEHYWNIQGNGRCEKLRNDRTHYGESSYAFANWFSTIYKCKEINTKQILWRQLQRFADENNDGELNWKDKKGKKYCIAKRDNDPIDVEEVTFYKDFGQVYFTSKEIAIRAIEEFEDELKEYFEVDK